MTTASPILLDLLKRLLRQEQDSLFRCLDEGTLYVSGRAGELHRPLEEMKQAAVRHSNRLAELIDSRGEEPPPPSLRPDDQYLGFLSINYLLPKLIQCKQQQIAEYQNALQALPPSEQDVAVVFHDHLKEHCRHLDLLSHAAAGLVPAGH